MGGDIHNAVEVKLMICDKEKESVIMVNFYESSFMSLVTNDDGLRVFFTKNINVSY